MGYNSVVMICNDGIRAIEQDPKGWWAKCWERLSFLSMGMGGGGRFGHGHHANAFQAVWNQHADCTAVILVGGNCATVVGSLVNGGQHNDEVLISVLETKGYKVTKTKQKV